MTRRYIQLVLEDHTLDNEIWPWGDEPIYLNDKRVGSTTTTGYGFTLGKHVSFLKFYLSHLFQNYIKKIPKVIQFYN